MSATVESENKTLTVYCGLCGASTCGNVSRLRGLPLCWGCEHGLSSGKFSAVAVQTEIRSMNGCNQFNPKSRPLTLAQIVARHEKAAELPAPLRPADPVKIAPTPPAFAPGAVATAESEAKAETERAALAKILAETSPKKAAAIPAPQAPPTITAADVQGSVVKRQARRVVLRNRRMARATVASETIDDSRTTSHDWRESGRRVLCAAFV